MFPTVVPWRQLEDSESLSSGANHLAQGSGVETRVAGLLTQAVSDATYGKKEEHAAAWIISCNYHVITHEEYHYIMITCSLHMDYALLHVLHVDYMTSF